MAHTDACKIQVTQFVKKLTEEKGLSVREACEVVEKESDGIPSTTIRRWFYKMKQEPEERLDQNRTTRPTPSIPTEIPEKGVAPQKVTTQNNSSIPEKGATQIVRGEKGHFVQGTVPPISPGRPPKNAPQKASGPGKAPTNENPVKPSAVAVKTYLVSDAMHFATIAISHLSSIREDDPKREEALNKVARWINNQLKEN